VAQKLINDQELTSLCSELIKSILQIHNICDKNHRFKTVIMIKLYHKIQVKSSASHGFTKKGVNIDRLKELFHF